MRSSQPSSPVAGSQEQKVSAVSAPANTDTVMQPIQALADDALINSQPADSTMQNESDQGIAADEGASATEGASAHVGTVLYAETSATQGIHAHGGVSIDKRPSANEETTALPQHRGAEAKQPASPQTGAHKTDSEEPGTHATDSAQNTAADSAPQVSSVPEAAQAAPKQDPGTEAVPATENSTAAPQQSSSGAPHATGTPGCPGQGTADSNDPRDPYSKAFKVQAWPFRKATG